MKTAKEAAREAEVVEAIAYCDQHLPRLDTGDLSDWKPAYGWGDTEDNLWFPLISQPGRFMIHAEDSPAGSQYWSQYPFSELPEVVMEFKKRLLVRRLRGEQ